MPDYQKFAKDVGIIGLAQLILSLKGMILMPIISKLLGASGYGIWAQVTVTIALVGPLLELGLTSALIRFLAAEKDKREIQEAFFSILAVMLSCGSVIALVLFCLAGPISDALFDGAAVRIVQMTALIVPFSALTAACNSYFITFRQMGTYSILNVSQQFGEVALVAGVVLSGSGVFGAVLSLLIVRSITGAVALGLVVSQIGIKRPRFSYLRAYLKFGLPLVPMEMFLWVTQSSDRYVIGYFLGMTQVGIYAASYGLGIIIIMLRYPLDRVLSPTLSKAYDERKIAEVRTYLRYSLKYFLMLAIPAAVGLSVLGKQILQMFTTEEFVSEGHLVIPFVALGMLLFGIYVIVGQVLKLVKKTRALATVWGIAGLANLGLNLAFVPHYGILAAAATTLAAYTLATGITCYLSSRELPFPVDWAFILKSLAASGVMSAVMLSLSPTRTWEVLLVVGLGAAVYGVALYLFRGVSRNEIRFFSELVGISKKKLPDS